MRIEHLSDHATDLLHQTEERQRRAKYREGIAQTKQRTAQVRLQTARRQKGWWRRLLNLVTPTEEQAIEAIDYRQGQIDRAAADYRRLTNQVAQQGAGVAGEHELATTLATQLSDEWLMLCGYRNRRGETDAILVGPLGLWAAEIKNRNARVNVDGERWWYEKVDRRGNVVDTGLAVNQSGRTWARQVIDVAEDLSRWLDRNHCPVDVRTAVVLTHDRAELATCRFPEVDLVTTTSQELVSTMTNTASPLSPDVCGAIADLIRRDHQHHNKPRSLSHS